MSPQTQTGSERNTGGKLFLFFHRIQRNLHKKLTDRATWRPQQLLKEQRVLGDHQLHTQPFRKQRRPDHEGATDSILNTDNRNTFRLQILSSQICQEEGTSQKWPVEDNGNLTPALRTPRFSSGAD